MIKINFKEIKDDYEIILEKMNKFDSYQRSINKLGNVYTKEEIKEKSFLFNYTNLIYTKNS